MAVLLWFVALLLLHCAAALGPQGTVEPGLLTWSCSGAECTIEAGCGRLGGACIRMGSNSTHGSRATSPLLPQLQAGTVWLVTVDAQCTARSGSGVPFVTVGGVLVMLHTAIKSADLGSGWARYETLVKVPHHNSASGQRLGTQQVSYDILCSFDRVALAPAEVAEFDAGGFGPLGRTERIGPDGTYNIVYGNEQQFLGNYDRTARNFSNGWDTVSLLVGTGSRILFNYTLAVPFAQPPNFFVRASTDTSGVIDVLSSDDNGASWTQLFNITTRGDFSVTLPSASSTLVQLANVGPPGGIYICKVEFTGKVATQPEEPVQGREIILVVESASQQAVTSGLSVSLGDENTFPVASAGWNTVVPFFVWSSSAASIRLSVVPRFQHSTASFKNTTLTLAAGEQFETTLLYHLGGGFEQTFDFSIADSSSGAALLSGRFIVYPMHPLLDTGYGELFASSAKSSLWWCGSTHKVSRHRPAPTTLSSNPIVVKAAQREYEPFQVVVSALASDITVSAATVSDLVNTADGSAIFANASVTVRQVVYIKTEFPQDARFGIAGGLWPDPLLPFEPFTCPARCNCPLWISISVGTASPGKYTGTVAVTVDGVTASVPLELSVWNFSLPKHTKFRSVIGTNWHEIYKYHHLDDATARKTQYLMYLKNLEEHRMAPHYADIWYGFGCSVKGVNGTETLVFNSKEFEAHWREFYSEEGFGFNTLTMYGLPGLDYTGPAQQPHGSFVGAYGTYQWGTPTHTRLFNECLAHIQDLLQRLGLLEHAIVYWYDEPKVPRDAPAVEEGMTAIHNAAPKLQRFLTKEPVSELYGQVDIWCPPFYNLVGWHDAVTRRQMVGDRVWTYLFGCTTSGRLEMYLDHPMTDMRLLFWKLFSDNAQGLMMGAIAWDTAKSSLYINTTQDPYEDPMVWSSLGEKFGNGVGRFLMPPPNWKTTSSPILAKPIDTVRWEMVREGVEDWEILTLLKQALSTRRLPANITAKAKELLKLPETMFVTDKIYATDPTELVFRREQAGDLLEEIAVTPDLPPESNDDDVDGAIYHLPPAFALLMLLATVALEAL